MRLIRNCISVIVVFSVFGFFGSGTLLAQDPIETISGEQLGSDAFGGGYIETMDEAVARDLIMRQREASDPMDNQGAWAVPSRRVKNTPFSGDHSVVNKWGDTRMGIGFLERVDVHGAYFAGIENIAVWTTGLRVIGYRDGEIVHETKWFRDLTVEPQWFAIDLFDVDRIEIESEAVLDGAGWYSMDDLTYSPSIDDIDDSEPYQDAARKIVVDFDDLEYNTNLTDTNYAGLEWELGTGRTVGGQAIHTPMGPPTPRDELEVDEDLDNERSSRAGTTPNLVTTRQRVIQGDHGSSYPPDTMGAVGPDHYVEAVNTCFSIYDKYTHSRVYHTALTTFMGGSGDPRILFDQHSQKWFVINSNFSSRIYIAVSLTDDPTGSWWKSYFTAAQGSDSGRWVDYPTLGVDEDGIYISAYMVGGPGHTIFALEKAPMVDGSPSWGVVTAFRDLDWEGAIQPAHTYGSTTSEYLVGVKDSNELRVRRINHPLTSPTLSIMGTPNVPSFGSPPDAPALGSSTDLDTVGDRLMMAVYRADTNSLWTCHTISGGAGAACRWYELDPTGGYKQYGTVSDGTWYYFFPSLMVNQYGSVVMAFTGSHSGAYAGCFYTGRLDSDPSGDMATPVQYKAGEGYQSHIDGYGRNRWGDYSYTTLDPTDNITFWTIQEYGDTSNNWGTYLAVLDFNDGDCQPNSIADMCDLDCGTPGGVCDVPGCGQSFDCNANNVPDECDIAGTTSADCNVNGTPDECDIAACDPNDLTCQDCNENGIPDQCDLDDCDPNDAACQDCQPNGIPDECDLLPPENIQGQDDCGDAQLACTNITYTGSNSAASTDGSASCATSGKDIWYLYIPNGFGSAIVSLCDSSFDTVLSVHSACPGTSGNEIVCDDDYCSPQSRVSFSVSLGVSYWIRIAGKNNATGNYSMIISGPDCQYDSECYVNGIPDECDLADCDGSPWCSDCQPNGVLDWCDIDEGTSSDTNTNGIPDECESGETCFDGIQNQGEDRIDCGGPCPACECTSDPACDDSTFCNGAETCDAYGVCQAGSYPCGSQMCRESDDQCVNCLVNGDCDNSVFCDGAEICDANGDCQAGSDPCPGEMCRESDDQCVECLTNGDCDDSAFCNGDETCDANGDCQAGSYPCGSQLCRESDDQCVDCLTNGDCDDSTFCNGDETCDANGDCQAGSYPCGSQLCRESDDQCVDCLTNGDCDDSDPCNGAETCDGNGDCQPGANPQSRGDTNGDGSINSLDIDPFVVAIANPAQYNINYAPLSWECTSDINCDGSINSLDIDPFVECLSGTCPPCP